MARYTLPAVAVLVLGLAAPAMAQEAVYLPTLPDYAPEDFKGCGLLNAPAQQQVPAHVTLPLPPRLTSTDLARLRATTAALRAQPPAKGAAWNWRRERARTLFGLRGSACPDAIPLHLTGAAE